MVTFAAADGVTIVYDDLGPRDGVPVVLCHGLAAAGEQMAADAAFFAERGYRVLVPDLRGHGRSANALAFPDQIVERVALDDLAPQLFDFALELQGFQCALDDKA